MSMDEVDRILEFVAKLAREDDLTLFVGELGVAPEEFSQESAVMLCGVLSDMLEGYSRLSGRWTHNSFNFMLPSFTSASCSL